MLLSLISLVFKFNRVIFVMIRFEYIVLGVIFYLLTMEGGFFILFFIFNTIISRVLVLVLLMSIVKRYGRDNCYY